MKSYLAIILTLGITACSQPQVQSTAPVAPIPTTTSEATQSTPTPLATENSRTKTPPKDNTNIESIEPKVESKKAGDKKSDETLTSSPNSPTTFATLTAKTPTSRINIREGASKNAKARHYGFAGDPVKILDEKQGNNGNTWYKVQFVRSGAEGWVSGNFVALKADSKETSSSIPEHTDSTTNEKTTEETAEEKTPTSGEQSTSSTTKQATLTSKNPRSRINIRDDASISAKARHYGFAGDPVIIIDEATGDNGNTWYKVKFVKSEAEGWVSGNFVSLGSNN
jgi:Bacterial SH3 domain